MLSSGAERWGTSEHFGIWVLIPTFFGAWLACIEGRRPAPSPRSSRGERWCGVWIASRTPSPRPYRHSKAAQVGNIRLWLGRGSASRMRLRPRLQFWAQAAARVFVPVASPAGTRTRDPMIKSHVLYRLSYGLLQKDRTFQEWRGDLSRARVFRRRSAAGQ